MKKRLGVRGLAAIVGISAFCWEARAATWHVDDSHSSGTRNGLSWATAFQFLNDAVNVAAAGDTIKVARGIYRADDIASGQGQGDRTKVFKLKVGTSIVGVVIEGGYIGYNDPNPNTRDWEEFVTILSGDLADNDGPGFANNGENSYTVVDGTGVSSTARLDGFVVAGGNGGQGGYGAGIYLGPGSSPTLQNIRVIANSAPSGGAMWIDSSCAPAISDSTFESNIADYGGAISLASSSSTLPVFARCKFISNVALVKGGAVLNDATGTTVRFRESLFIANEARGTDAFNQQGGGAICNESTAKLRLENCVLSRNVALGNGGAIDCESQNTLTVTNCSFSANRSLFGADGGGGLRVAGGSTATMTNCVLWGNSDSGGTDETAQVFKSSNSTLTATYNSIQGWGSGGTGNNGSDPLFIGSANDILRLSSLSPSIDAGNNGAVPGDLTTDADGRTRILYSAVDRGAYENDLDTDCDGNRTSDDGEIEADPNKDCNSNRTLDVCEIVPIGTGLDCNSNGLIDACEIAAGSSFDCQGDGIPDECQFTSDCDHNCVDDSSEITGNDCDSSGVLDACEAVLPRIWTTDADFEEGTLINVNHSTSGQLKRNAVASIAPLPYVWVAASGKGTVVRIDSVGGSVIGEYHTGPEQHIINAFASNLASNPSRTTVDLDGSMWAANRDDGPNLGSVVKIGLVIGGTRVNADGAANSNGDYLKGPFDYCTCEDRDGDGLIKTSRGLGDIRSWNNWNGADDAGGMVNAEDECILRYVRVQGLGTRTVAIDKDNNVWVGGYDGTDRKHEKLNGFTGATISGTEFNDSSWGGYGGLVDCAGTLWSASHNSILLRVNTANVTQRTAISVIYSYGLGIDTNGLLWVSNFENDSVQTVAPNGTVGPTAFPTEGATNDKGVAITPADNHVWVANSGGANVSRLNNSGTFLKSIELGVDGTTPTGIAVDAAGKIWLTCEGSDTVKRINPAGGIDMLGDVDLTLPLDSTANPYNYSDMTGMVGLLTSGTGTWNVVHDGKFNDVAWGRIVWNTESCASPHEPGGTGLIVEVRASNSEVGLPQIAYTGVTSGACLTSIAGRYVEVRVRFRGVCPPNSDTPVLCDLRVVPASTCLKADVDLNGVKNGRDIQDFLDQFFPARACPTQLCPADLDGDGAVDLDDIPLFATCLVTEAVNCGINNCGPGGVISYPDCNTNGISDVIDIGFGTSLDCNTDGIPDECDIDESDPDGNELVSVDVNTNTIPDECEPDCNNNGVPDAWDITMVTSSDVNTNGVPDECEPDCDSDGLPDSYEVAQGAADCNANGTPDTCEPDCNTNGVPDDCDIDPTDPDGDQWVSPDCNSNAFPDECDLAIPGFGSLDCNTNGIPDECDIAACEGDPACSDCNSNGIPDACDIAAQVSEDVNTNGIPDECEGEGMMGGESQTMSGETGQESEGGQAEAWDAFYEWADQQCWGPACESSGAEQFAATAAKLQELGLPVQWPPMGP